MLNVGNSVLYINKNTIKSLEYRNTDNVVPLSIKSLEYRNKDNVVPLPIFLNNCFHAQCIRCIITDQYRVQ